MDGSLSPHVLPKLEQRWKVRKIGESKVQGAEVGKSTFFVLDVSLNCRGLH